MVFSEIETIDVKPSELPQSLVKGRVDAICTWEPHILKAKELLGKKASVMPSKGVYREDFYFVANRKFMKNNPETLKKFLSAIERGEEFIRRNKKESINIVSQGLKLNRDLTALIWLEFNFQLLLDQTILISLEDEARWAIKRGLQTRKKFPIIWILSLWMR